MASSPLPLPFLTVESPMINKVGARLPSLFGSTSPANTTVEINAGTTPSPNRTSVGIRYTKVGKVCMRSSTLFCVCSRFSRAAASVPQGAVDAYAEPSLSWARYQRRTKSRKGAIGFDGDDGLIAAYRGPQAHVKTRGRLIANDNALALAA